jgi:hypothetical protein
MRRLSLFAFIVVILPLFFACSKTPTGNEPGRIRILAMDSPLLAGVEHIYLTIKEVGLHRSESGWITVAQPDSTFDFLELVNGVTKVLLDTLIQSGHYTQMRLVVADTNQIVVNGDTFPLVVPSGTETGVKLNLDFVLQPGQLMEFFVDFDASRSVEMVNGAFLLHPTYRALPLVQAGTISGTVKNAGGSGIPSAEVQAVGLVDTITTLTDSSGEYKLILAPGTYDLSAMAAGYSSADTSYQDVQVQAGDKLTGYDFILH